MTNSSRTSLRPGAIRARARYQATARQLRNSALDQFIDVCANIRMGHYNLQTADCLDFGVMFITGMKDNTFINTKRFTVMLIEAEGSLLLIPELLSSSNMSYFSSV